MAVTVLVSGGGGAAAISTIKALRMGGFDGRIVSTDAERLSAGLYLADAFRVVPRAKDPAFFPAILRLIEDEHIGVIFPTSGFDIYEFARHKGELEAMGVVVAMSDADAMATCENKWQFYLKTQGVFPLPETGRDAQDLEAVSLFCEAGIREREPGYPSLHDPRGTGIPHAARPRHAHPGVPPGRGVHRRRPLRSLGRPPARGAAGAPRNEGRHLRPRAGSSATRRWSGSASTSPDTSASRAPPACSSSATNAGRPKFMEVNPRIGGGSMFTTLAGVNIPILLLQLIAGMELAPQKPKEIVVLRYYEEVVLDDHEH